MSTATAKFWAKVKVSDQDSCWEWLGSRNKLGYGTRTGGLAHREAYRLVHGDIPVGKVVCHSCDNPPCCNPAHLWAGTMLENTRDSIAKGRFRRANGEQNGRAKLTDAQVDLVRNSFRAGETRAEIAAHLEVNWSTVDRVLRAKGRFVTSGTDLIAVHAREVKVASAAAQVRRGQQHGRSTFSDDQIREIRSLHGAGLRVCEIARKVERPWPTIHGIICGRTWGHVQ